MTRTIVHGGTHFNHVLSTDDCAYGETACQNLAVSNPTNAVYNTDNHAFSPMSKRFQKVDRRLMPLRRVVTSLGEGDKIWGGLLCILMEIVVFAFNKIKRECMYGSTVSRAGPPLSELRWAHLALTAVHGPSTSRCIALNVGLYLVHGPVTWPTWPMAMVEVSKAFWPTPCLRFGRLTWDFINATGRVFATHACFPTPTVLPPRHRLSVKGEDLGIPYNFLSMLSYAQ